LQAEKELEVEILEVVAEANTFVEGWGSIIFQSAGEMIANEKMRTVYEETAVSRAKKGALINAQYTNTSLNMISSEKKYGRVGIKIDLPLPQPVLMPAPPPGHPAHAAALAAAAVGSAPGSAPGTPVRPPNGLIPPARTSNAEGVASSDGEGRDTPSPSKSVSIV